MPRSAADAAAAAESANPRLKTSSWHKPSELGYNMFGYFVFVFGGLVVLLSAEVTCMIITLYIQYL